ncbi:MAG: hypoxanthine phosphoribosyltransferase [Lachnospiraceae bacterium]|nr:hypoxanthine phosphoribosyltransferase [Lachnospiraceae bacterium]
MADKLRVMITEEEIDKRIREIADEINREYREQEVHLICVLRGGSFFMCELAKRITCPVTLDFIACSSYGNDTKSSGVVRIVKDLSDSIVDKNVIVIEDVVDTGRTLNYLLDMLRDRKPRSLKLCALLDKPSRRVVEVKTDYIGFTIPDEFVVGYGLDYAQRYRNLPYIAVIEPQAEE